MTADFRVTSNFITSNRRDLESPFILQWDISLLVHLNSNPVLKVALLSPAHPFWPPRAWDMFILKILLGVKNLRTANFLFSPHSCRKSPSQNNSAAMPSSRISDLRQICGRYLYVWSHSCKYCPRFEIRTLAGQNCSTYNNNFQVQ